MFPQPPNAQRIAHESVVPVNSPPFQWAVFATDVVPEEVIAFYAQAIGRPPDEAACRWHEPRTRPLHSLGVFPAARTVEIPPSARDRIPPGSRTLVLMRTTPSTRPHENNVLPANLSSASLLEATLAGRLVWSWGEPGVCLKAGGRVPAGLHSGREIWVTLGRTGRQYVLALTSEMRPYGEEDRQHNGWFSRCELATLWQAAERSAGGRG